MTNPQSKSEHSICVLGLWHLGLVSAAALSDLGFNVTAFDPNETLIKNLHKGQLPLYEPGLDALIQSKIKAKHLRFAQNYQDAVSGAETILITFDTPVDDNDKADLTIIHNTFRAMIPFLNADALIIVNSQVPVGSCETWQEWIDRDRPGTNIDVVYSPENLRLGQAIELYKKPDMIVIGYGRESARKKAEAFFSRFPSEKFFVSLRTAEMAKHALNTFFATSISFANEIGNLCEACGADGIEIAKILKQDSRIGKKAQVRPGLGFSGGTLARDVTTLQQLGKQVGHPTRLMDSVLEINQKQNLQVVKKITNYFKHQLAGKKLAFLGLTYKPGTSTLRRSASIEIINNLTNQGTLVQAHDPKANLGEYSGILPFTFFQDPYQASSGAHAIILMTEWPEYKELDFGRIKATMANAMIFDVKNLLDENKIKALGFDYLNIGRGQRQGEKLSCE